MTTKYTPGPWHAGDELCGVISVYTDDAWIVEVSHCYGMKEGQREANARLIAAAPDLLECLQDVLLTGGDSYRCWGNEAQRQGHNEMLKKVRAIIKKATTPQD